MPRYSNQDPRHPHNRLRTLYHAWTEAELIGQQIPVPQAQAMVKLAAGISNRAAVYEYIDDIDTLGLATWEKGEGLTPRPNGLAILDAVAS